MSESPGDPHRETRRSLLKKAAIAGGVLWAVPIIDSVVVPAAAASPVTTTATAGLFKSGNGSSDTPLAVLCAEGASSPAGRGSAVFTRTDIPATICVTVTLSTGFGVAGREIFILQSNAGGSCIGGQVVPVGTWAPAPVDGPQTFCAPVVGGATRFVVAQQLSGGGGNDGWSSAPPVSLP